MGLVGTEREQLEAFLDENREELVATLAGLTEEQARRRLVTSLSTPMAILKHCAAVERAWFQRSLAGRSAEEIDGIANGSDASFEVGDDETVDSVVAEYRLAVEQSRRIAVAYDLDDLALHNRRGPLTLRWIYLHMIEELARHAGHADILREQILSER
ncbi:MAG: DinB family protein [Actinomycetota bacterium]|nr:DinB family protein [Actinomycetota bacterium]